MYVLGKKLDRVKDGIVTGAELEGNGVAGYIGTVSGRHHAVLGRTEGSSYGALELGSS